MIDGGIDGRLDLIDRPLAPSHSWLCVEVPQVGGDQLSTELCLPARCAAGRSQGPAYRNYFDSGGGGLPRAVQSGSFEVTFANASQAGTYCIGSQGISGEMKMTLRVQP